MASVFQESELQLAAIQLESIKADYSHKSLLQKFRYRFGREFLRQNADQKARFLKTVLSRAGEKVLSQITRRFGDRQRKKTTNRLCAAAICTGGMGDLIIASAFLERFSEECGCPEIDVIVAAPRLKAAKFVFQELPTVDRVIAQADLNPRTTPYDLIVKIGDLVSYEFIRESAVERLVPGLLARLCEGRRIQQQYGGFIDRQPNLDGLFASSAAKAGMGRLDVLGWLANVSFTQGHQLRLSPDPVAYQVLAENDRLLGKPYITIHNGWDNVDHRHAEAVTKAWPAGHYAEFVEQFKNRFPNVEVVQVGTKTSKPVANVDHCLLNATSLDESAWILKNSLLHIDGDSGLVHLARSLHTTSLVLFGPTNHTFFAYRQNLKLYSKNCNNCWWTTNDWMHACPRGLKIPECMPSIHPAAVLALAEAYLRSLPAWKYSIEDVCADCVTKPFVAGHSRPEEARQREQQSIASEAILDGPPRSLYNIPVENESFDLAHVPSFTERVNYPFFAIRELLRTVMDGGRLLLTFDFGSSRGGADSFESSHARTRFVEALKKHGVITENRPAGRLVIRKRRAGSVWP
jgi:ADP-heptose:LPS heptosyltransferase